MATDITKSSRLRTLNNMYFFKCKEELHDPSLSDSMPYKEYKIFSNQILDKFNENNKKFNEKNAEEKAKIEALENMIDCCDEMADKKTRWGKYTVCRGEFRRMYDQINDNYIKFKSEDEKKNKEKSNSER